MFSLKDSKGTEVLSTQKMEPGILQMSAGRITYGASIRVLESEVRHTKQDEVKVNVSVVTENKNIGSVISKGIIKLKGNSR